jgi:NAD(P)-dependent dehydrogenase (short-subunit alcohol dehydrogenase family)
MRAPRRARRGGNVVKAAELFNVRGLGVIVTGAASGIGLACARVLAANGANVALIDRDAERLADAVAEVSASQAAGGARALGEVADVTDRAALEGAFAAAAAAFGRIDVVFANAGVGGGPGFLSADGARSDATAIEAIAPDRWAAIIDTDLSGVLRTLQAAVRHMKAGGGGRIVVTTSIAALKTETVIGTPYPVAKAGAAHLVRQAALELARYNIKVNAMAPGPFLTNISGGRLQDPAVRAHHVRSVPLGRIASTDEIMGLALFLASPASDYMTGAQIVIDGGAMLGRAD